MPKCNLIFIVLKNRGGNQIWKYTIFQHSLIKQIVIKTGWFIFFIFPVFIPKYQRFLGHKPISGDIFFLVVQYCGYL